MALKLARRSAVSPFIVMDVLRAANARAAAGASVLHLEVGQPASAAPSLVLEAARDALAEERLGYTDALGLPALRDRIAAHYQDNYATAVDPERVVVTAGSSAGFLLSFLAAFDPGDRVALASPGYPAYRNILQTLGLEPVLVPCGAAERFQPTPELLAAAGPLDGLILASPSNPTGTMLDRTAFARLVDFCREQGIRLVSDEIYHGITFGRDAVTALELSDDAIVVNSFSKYFSMTGWRLGWLVLPQDMVRPVECLAQNLFISAHSLSQHAALRAFDCREELEGHVARYAANRALLLERLPAAGLSRLAPSDGAFYIYADIGDLTNDSADWCRRALEETGVAMTPGLDFDPVEGHRFLRLSFAGEEAEMAEAVDRLGHWISR